MRRDGSRGGESQRRDEGHLLDTSVIHRLDQVPVRQRIADLRANGASLFRCTVVDLAAIEAGVGI